MSAGLLPVQRGKYLSTHHTRSVRLFLGVPVFAHIDIYLNLNAFQFFVHASIYKQLLEELKNFTSGLRYF